MENNESYKENEEIPNSKKLANPHPHRKIYIEEKIQSKHTDETDTEKK